MASHKVRAKMSQPFDGRIKDALAMIALAIGDLANAVRDVAIAIRGVREGDGGDT